MVDSLVGGQTGIRAISNSDLDRLDAQKLAIQVAAEKPLKQEVLSNLASFIRQQFDEFKRHRNSAHGWTERLNDAMRAFKGEYPPDKLQAIREFGGSEVYARIIAMKCRGASSLLRDVYLQADRPWGLEPPADPDVPEPIQGAIQQLVTAETGNLAAMNNPATADQIRERVFSLMADAREAARKRAKEKTRIAEDRIDEYLDEGGFYHALAEFLVDLPLFPFACIKGPVVRVVQSVSWQGPSPTITHRPKMFWNRVSPFDLFWTPGVSRIEDAAVIERQRLTRADLNDLLDLPGYHKANIRKVLEEYPRGISDDHDYAETERANFESRESPVMNESGLYTTLEYNGNVQGKMLREYGMSSTLVPDELRDYMVTAWLIGSYVIKVQMSPSPRRRHPYFVTSFEKVPGTVVGNGLPDILADIGDVANATLRALVNNLSIASGPQVVINTDRLAAGEDPNSLYPWKRWQMTGGPLANNTQVPVSFFQPRSNAQELLTVYKEFSAMADDLSAIPRYLSGQGASGGAGRTASGLAMLMGNASKILQTVAANIDRDVFSELLSSLYDLIMLTDSTGLLTGEEGIKVMGVAVAIQRETQRARQLEFLQITANPVDVDIMGKSGRAEVLRSVARTLGMNGEQVVPSSQQMEERAKQEAMMAAQQAQQGPQDPEAAGRAAQGMQQGSTVSKDMGPRTNITGGP